MLQRTYYQSCPWPPLGSLPAFPPVQSLWPEVSPHSCADQGCLPQRAAGRAPLPQPPQFLRMPSSEPHGNDSTLRWQGHARYN